MDIVIAVLVLAAALAALAYPMYSAWTQAVTLDASTLDDLLAQRDGVYATLRDLELDRELGKLDANDYESLRERYMTRATQILQQLDALRGEGATREASVEIEKEVAALRRPTTDDEPRTTTVDRVTEKPVPTAIAEAKPPELQCANCGRPYRAGDKFCAQCGQPLD